MYKQKARSKNHIINFKLILNEMFKQVLQKIHIAHSHRTAKRIIAKM